MPTLYNEEPDSLLHYLRAEVPHAGQVTFPAILLLHIPLTFGSKKIAKWVRVW